GAGRGAGTPPTPPGDWGSGVGQCRLSRGPRARLGEPPADDVALARRAAGARGTAPLGSRARALRLPDARRSRAREPGARAGRRADGRARGPARERADAAREPE